MKILGEITREEITQKFGNHRDAEYFAVTPFKHYYRVALTADEYKNLLMNSSPTKLSAELEELPRLEESVQQFLSNPKFLTQAHPNRGISGTTVAEYLEGFKNGMELNDCFVEDKDEKMRPEGSFYICEGMHRLNAYGIYKKLNIKDGEVKVIYNTNNERTF